MADNDHYETRASGISPIRLKIGGALPGSRNRRTMAMSATITSRETKMTDDQLRAENARLKAANRQLEQELADLRSREMDADDIASYVELVKELRDKLEEARKELARRNRPIR